MSTYPFVQVALFLPAFDWQGGLYIGTGAGVMMSSFRDQYGQRGRDNFFMMDVVTVGATFSPPALRGFGFSASYTMRTDFSSFTDRVSVGIVYRFRTRSHPDSVIEDITEDIVENIIYENQQDEY
jgi:hypothetical protein